MSECIIVITLCAAGIAGLVWLAWPVPGAPGERCGVCLRRDCPDCGRHDDV